MKPRQGVLRIGERPLSIEDIEDVARGRLDVALSSAEGFNARIARGAAIVEQRLANDIPTYGVNTGFGASVKHAVAIDYAHVLAKNLPRYHGCGVGPLLSESESRA
ncbi:MAG TPA: aromatic amino acid lyase, partial [Polyangiales bacterium]